MEVGIEINLKKWYIFIGREEIRGHLDAKNKSMDTAEMNLVDMESIMEIYSTQRRFLLYN